MEVEIIIMDTQKKKLLPLLVAPRALQRLQKLAQISNTTKGGVIVRALQLFCFFILENQKGTVFFIKRPGGQIEHLRIFKPRERIDDN